VIAGEIAVRGLSMPHCRVCAATVWLLNSGWAISAAAICRAGFEPLASPGLRGLTLVDGFAVVCCARARTAPGGLASTTI
jgi:hypothetical protein